jgi:predicted Zn-dependent protease
MGRRLGAQVADSVTLIQDAEVRAYVLTLGKILASRLPENPFAFRFEVFDDTKPVGAMPRGGFVFPYGPRDNGRMEPIAVEGGPIFIPAGLLRNADSEAQFAGMLAHSIAHIGLRHPTRLATRAQQLSGEAAPPSQPGDTRNQDNSNATLFPEGLLSLARDYELEADVLATRIMASAGYDPKAFIQLLQRLPHGTQIGIFRPFTAVPSIKSRIAAIRKEAQSLPAKEYPGQTGQFETIRAALASTHAR